MKTLVVVLKHLLATFSKSLATAVSHSLSKSEIISPALPRSQEKYKDHKIHKKNPLKYTVTNAK